MYAFDTENYIRLVEPKRTVSGLTKYMNSQFELYARNVQGGPIELILVYPLLYG